MTPRTIRVVSVQEGSTRPRVDTVELLVVPDWLKGNPIAVASLTPSDARSIAIDLLIAAQVIDSRKPPQ